MSARIYIEGGGESKELHARCREGFRKLLERCGFTGRMPRLVACGSRESAFDDFATAHDNAEESAYVAMWIDSEEPMPDIEEAWKHLEHHDRWSAPDGASDEQVLLMVTCMETWIVSDRAALDAHYGQSLQASALPAEASLESRCRQDVQDALIHATRRSKNAYTKGKRSFEILGKLNPATLGKVLPSFSRCERILDAKL